MEENCPICLEIIKKNCYETSCKHKFHKKCLQEWKNKNREATCPVCRSHVIPEFRINVSQISITNPPPNRERIRQYPIFINFRNIYVTNIIDQPVSRMKKITLCFLLGVVVIVYLVGFIINKN